MLKKSTARVKLLGAFGLIWEQRSVKLSMSAQRLIAFLALHDRPVLRLYVAGTLWPDTCEERASASLRSTLWRLHRRGYELIEAEGEHIRLAGQVVVDLRGAAALARRVLDRVDGDELDVDLAALTTDLLPDWYEDWVLLEREHFRQLRLHALDTLCERLTSAGRFSAALEAGHAAVTCDPLRESAHRALVRVHLAESNSSEVIRQYRFCRRLLRDRLGLEPSVQMRELVHDVSGVEARG
jgi:DNA-binding SARP family transcriptional activator